jgi:cytoskeletal protein CcmA (bactofilin family)
MAIFDGKKQGGEPLDGYLGRAAEVEGTLRFPDLLRVDGTVRGKVFTAKELVVGEEGLVDAEVDVGFLSVAGRVRGKITVRERLEIHAGGRVEGELHMMTPALLIEEGGILEGTVKMGTSDDSLSTPLQVDGQADEDVEETLLAEGMSVGGEVDG